VRTSRPSPARRTIYSVVLPAPRASLLAASTLPPCSSQRSTPSASRAGLAQRIRRSSWISEAASFRSCRMSSSRDSTMRSYRSAASIRCASFSIASRMVFEDATRNSLNLNPSSWTASGRITFRRENIWNSHLRANPDLCRRHSARHSGLRTALWQIFRIPSSTSRHWRETASEADSHPADRATEASTTIRLLFGMLRPRGDLQLNSV
jgi:hypothetical protein